MSAGSSSGEKNHSGATDPLAVRPAAVLEALAVLGNTAEENFDVSVVTALPGDVVATSTNGAAVNRPPSPDAAHAPELDVASFTVPPHAVADIGRISFNRLGINF